MMEFRNRLIWGVLVLAGLTAGLMALHTRFNAELRSFSTFSGILLFLVFLVLAGFNARKKLPFLPLLKASTWMQIHIYGGYFAIIVFLFHIEFRWPHGSFEILLAVLFILVSLSGILGLALSRWLPSRLTAYGENLIFERISPFRAAVKNDLEKLVFESVGTTSSTTLADFYNNRLQPFFERPVRVWTHLIGAQRPALALLSEVESLQRYLNPQEKQIAAQMADFVRTKDNLDFQWAGQGLLKLWLFLHIPLSFVLIILSLAHAWFAWSFS